MKRPHLVMDRHVEHPPEPSRKQAPASREEVGERVPWLSYCAGADDEAATRAPRAWPTAARRVLELSGVLLHAHPRPAVRQSERQPRSEHNREPGGIQRQKHHTSTSALVDAVETHVGLGERAQPWCGKRATDPGIDHPEGDKSHPRCTVVHIGPDTRGHQRRDDLWVGSPVHEGQVPPALAHERATGQSRRLRTRRFRRGARHVHACMISRSAPSTSGRCHWPKPCQLSPPKRQPAYYLCRPSGG